MGPGPDHRNEIHRLAATLFALSQGTEGSKPAENGPITGAHVIRCLLLLAAFSFGPILSFWATNVEHDPRVSALLVLGAAFFAGAAFPVLVFGRGSLAALHRAAGIGSVLLIALFNWRAFGGFRSPPLAMEAAEHLLAAVITVALVLVMYRWGASRYLRGAAFGMAAVVAIVSVTQLVRAELAVDHVAVRRAAIPIARAEAGGAPDVYYIVLDGYGRFDVLGERYGLDLTAFRSELEKRGFVVPSRATSNYPVTTMSIPSALAMDYPLEPGMGLGPDEEQALNRIARGENPVVGFLRGRGYRYVHVESSLPATRCGDAVDVCVSWPPIDDTVLGLLEGTPLAPLLEKQLQRGTVRSKLAVFDRLETLARDGSEDPRFVFAHMLVPHPPLFLRADCEMDLDSRRSGNDVGAPPFREYIAFRMSAYADQVRCVNRLLLELLDAIPTDTVVVVAGDHGPDAGEQLWKPAASWTDEDIEERVPIFHAVRLPERCRSNFPADVSLVNTFRIVFNCVFDTGMPLLPNRLLLVRTGEALIERPPL